MLDNVLEASMGMKCTEIAQATLARFHKREYRLMFADCWNFNFIEDEIVIDQIIEEYQLEEKWNPYKNTIGMRLSGKVIGIDENLYHYHGIKTNYFIWEGNELLVEIIQALNANKYVSIWYDQFYMPWAKEMRKKAPLRYDGFLLLLEYKEYLNAFLCIDIHGSRKIEILPFELFQEYINLGEKHKVIIYEILDTREEKLSIVENMERQLLKVGYGTSNTICDKIRKFAYFVRNNLDMEKEENYSLLDIKELSAPTHIEGIKRIRDIARMRNLYAITLEYYAEKESEIIQLVNKFRIAASNWQNIVSLLVKSSYLKEYKELKERVEILIINCADYELDIMKCMAALQKKIKSNYYIVGNRSVFDKEKKVELDIKCFYNNKAFAITKLNKENADIDGMGSFLLLKLQEGYKSEMVEHIRYDNVICDGQTIIVNEEVKDFFIIGTCDSGAYYGSLDILYSDGILENKLIGFGEWRFEKCELGEKVVWKGERVCFGKLCIEENGYIFECKLNNFRNVRIKTIVLPKNKHIHIFKIFFVRGGINDII